MLKKDILKASIFELDFFKENNFKRYKCESCGSFFWSLKERENCGEPPCDIYRFINNPTIPKKYNWKELREKYIKWFQKNGHQPINRYPTIARWKPDTFYTGASIYCFMPWVLNRTVEPPANPLVMSQPSLRFVDLDNVGLGTGRHLTVFEMMAHHAFNNEKKIYWKDETVDLCYRWLTESLGIKPEKVAFKESWWEGGGNAGPCFEVIVDGNELATLVFMEYEGPFKGKYKKMEMKVVDTGYGLERHVWASQGTPTIYDNIYESIINFLKKEKNVEKEILSEFCKVCGKLEIKRNVELLRNKIIEEISKKLGKRKEEILKQILFFHKIYQIADHTKAIMFILGDGVVPSNVREGYLARLLIRRSIRNLQDLELKIPLSEIVEMQIEESKDVYPEFEENKTDILKMVEIEEKKYLESLKRGKFILKKLLKGKKKVDRKILIMLYDSHGLLPRDVKRFIPEIKLDLTDIETRIAVQKSIVKAKEKIKEVDISNLTKTRKLYYENEKLFNFKAKVIKIENENVILDQTAFYPRGGGQEPDLGTIEGCRVYDVEMLNGVIIHKVENPNFKVNDIVNCVVDKKRREQIKKHHTATHIINGAARRVLGNHVWQAGSKKDYDKAHLDITHYNPLTNEELKNIEKIANDIVKRGVVVKKLILPRNLAERKYGFRLYQGGAIPGKELRIIAINEWDVEACGGLHVDNTKEVEEIFITDSKKIQDGVIRIEYVAGKELVEKAKREKEEKEREKKEILKRKLLRIKEEKEKIRLLKKKRIRLFGINYIETEDMKELEIIGKESIKEDPTKYSILIGRGIVFGIRGEKCNVNIEPIVKEIAKIMGGSAGGKGNEYKGGGPLKEKGKEAFKKVSELL